MRKFLRDCDLPELSRSMRSEPDVCILHRPGPFEQMAGSLLSRCLTRLLDRSGFLTNPLEQLKQNRSEGSGCSVSPARWVASDTGCTSEVCCRKHLPSPWSTRYLQITHIAWRQKLFPARVPIQRKHTRPITYDSNSIAECVVLHPTQSFLARRRSSLLLLCQETIRIPIHTSQADQQNKMKLSRAILFAFAIPTTAFVTPRAGLPTKKYLFSPMHPDRKLPWTAQQTSSTLQYRTLGNTALVNEYLYIYKTENNGIAVMTNASAAFASSSSDTVDDSMLASVATMGYAYEGYSYNSNEIVIQLQSVIKSLHSQMEQQNRLIMDQKEKTDKILAEKQELQAALESKEAEFAESMMALLGKYESLLAQVEEAKHKVVFPEPIHEAPAPATTIGQIKNWAAQGDQGRVLARQALQEGRVQAHRITMSFHQKLHAKDQEIALLKEQLVAERLQRSHGAPEERAKRESTPELMGWIGQVAHVMSNYAKVHELAPETVAATSTLSRSGVSLRRTSSSSRYSKHIR